MGRLDKLIQYAKAQPSRFVYAINDANGTPVYVGRTRHPERRWRQHREGTSARHLPALGAWLACNPASFEVLDTYPDTRSHLDAEREYIAYLRPRFNVQFNPAAHK